MLYVWLRSPVLLWICEVIQAITMRMGMSKIPMKIKWNYSKLLENKSNIFLIFYSPSTNRFSQSTFHHHVYTPAASSVSGWASSGGGGGAHKSKNNSLQTSALTLLAFLFFINMLHTCLKEQMTSLNPTVCFTLLHFAK